MILIKVGAIVLFCGCAAVAQSPAPTAADIAAGARIYRTQCSYCHGPRGEGGRGAPLARPRLVHAPDDAAMSKVIADGIPDSEMPGHWLTPHEIWQLVAFVRTLGRTAPQQINGDPARGGQLYGDKGGCPRCHTIAGRGGALGPDLGDIGARRSAAYLREALLAPEAAVPDEFLQVQIITRDGRRITGARLNEDAFSIQIRDLSNEFRSFWKTELIELKKEPGKSPMPSYSKVFTSQELDDVIAYLDLLRGGQ
jgi:cytochrome c oxidase cbb3-type subunit 3